MFNFNMDISDNSVWINSTPGVFARSLPFYCSEIGEFFAGRTFFTERDYKNSYWLVYTVDGEGEMYYGGEYITLVAGSCCIIDCKEYHRYSTAKNAKDWHHCWVHLDGGGVDNYFIKGSQNRILFTLKVRHNTQELFKDLLNSSKNPDTDHMLESSILLHQIVHNVFKGDHNIDSDTDERRRNIYATAKFLRDNCQNRILLEEMAYNAHLSKYHFSRLFKHYMGTSPYDYLLHHRITKAKHALCTTDLSVGEIALQCGFASESNFSSQFSRLSGMSPNRYRKEHYKF